MGMVGLSLHRGGALLAPDRTIRSQPLLRLSDARAVRAAARALAAGMGVFHGFGNGYALSALPSPAAARRITLLCGRSGAVTGGVTTGREELEDLFDWSRLPDGLDACRVVAAMDALLAVGPLGLRGPASPRVPDHLTAAEGEARTVCLIAPGLRCPSNAFLTAALDLTGERLLAVAWPGRVRDGSAAGGGPPVTGADIATWFGDVPGLLLLAHDDDAAAQRPYRRYAAAPPTLLAFHRPARNRRGRPALVIERPGSLAAVEVARVLRRFGLGCVRLRAGDGATGRSGTTGRPRRRGAQRPDEPHRGTPTAGHEDERRRG
jgi:hypothetical protein